MNEIASIVSPDGLSGLVRRAADQLASATTAAEVLEARDLASVAYDAAKKAARLAKAKAAHDEIIVKAAHAQADALEIESAAKRRLAAEYDAAQERGEVSRKGQHAVHLPAGNMRGSVADVGLSSKAIHDARLIRDAEEADPGIVRRTLDERLANGEEPNRATLRRAIQPERKPVVADDSLWLWGRLRDFERNGYFSKDPHSLLDGMTQPMRGDVRQVLPRVRVFLERLEEATNEHA